MAVMGILVYLVTGDSENASTDDQIYLGMWGNSGGREFPLSDSSSGVGGSFIPGGFMYVLGMDPTVDGPERVDAQQAFHPRPIDFLLRSDRSLPGEANDPGLFTDMSLDTISTVYVRKQAYGTGGDDDAWQLTGIAVFLWESAGSYRLFSLFPPSGLWFGNEFGHQAWLIEDLNAARAGKPGATLQEKLGQRLP
jgi:hypothetical protein